MHIRLLKVACIIISLIAPAMLCAQEKKPGPVATVNGSEISAGDFYRELNRIQRLVLGTGRPLTCSQVTHLRTEVVEGMVQRELLWQESRKKVKVTEEEIDDELKKLKDQYASEGDFSKALAEMKVTPSVLRSQIEQTLSIKKLTDTQLTSVGEVSDKEVKAYYDNNKASLKRPEQVRAHHILIKTEPTWDAEKKAEARKRIDDIAKKARKGQDFESLARTYSEDKVSAGKDGDLGYVARGQVVKPFEEALFSLKPGQVSAVVETHLGYHIIKAGDHKPEGQLSYDEVKDRIAAVLKQQKKQQVMKNYVDGLRKNARVEITLPADE